MKPYNLQNNLADFDLNSKKLSLWVNLFSPPELIFTENANLNRWSFDKISKYIR